MKTTKIYVGNLPEKCTNDDLRELFEKYGQVKECDIVRNYAFVHMSTDDEAKYAIDGLRNYEFMGQKLQVELSHSKVRQRPGMGGKGQCYRCGRQGHWSKECPRNPAARRSGDRRGANSDLHLSMYSASEYSGRYRGYSGFERSYAMERGYPEQRGYIERMRPYPDPYERRAPLPSSQENFMYYRRPYESYNYARRSPPMSSAIPRYDFTQDTFIGDRIPNATRRAPVY